MTSTWDRFWRKVDATSTDCWLWTGGIHSNGYARMTVDTKPVYGHRWSYELHKGPIPDGLHIDHLCKVRRCVRPDHLEAVTQEENNRRTKLSHCKRGHPFDEANTYVDPKGTRSCRACHALRELKRYRSRRAMQGVS